MKKVAIITINGNFNYGNRLQNYALKHTLEELGCDVTNLWFITAKEYIKDKIKKFPIINKKMVRYNRFSDFTKKYLNVRYCPKSYNKDLFDNYVVGSDQVWNYTFPTYDQKMFLPFSSKEKNSSYAGSFGLENIEDDKVNEITNGLNNLQYISVREQRAKEIVEDLTGRKDIEVVVDPTMLLEAQEWDKILKKPTNLNTKRYILNYFLGEMSEKVQKEIEKYAQDNECQIINILKSNDPFYSCGPEEFLYLEKHAFLICTDSFHSSVFAIIYNKPFIVFDRNDHEVKMSSRIDTLLNKFNLEKQKYVGNIFEQDINIDYKYVNNVLQKEIKEAKKFIKKSIGIK